MHRSFGKRIADHRDQSDLSIPDPHPGNSVTATPTQHTHITATTWINNIIDNNRTDGYKIDRHSLAESLFQDRSEAILFIASPNVKVGLSLFYEHNQRYNLSSTIQRRLG
jgi:hypothetical protein